ncbi:hypothetical protein KM043_003795 [Ampulex compressa]|nr:hypothetical protein KM043_003795 [Ampulex compressa]
MLDTVIPAARYRNREPTGRSRLKGEREIGEGAGFTIVKGPPVDLRVVPKTKGRALRDIGAGPRKRGAGEGPRAGGGECDGPTSPEGITESTVESWKERGAERALEADQADSPYSASFDRQGARQRASFRSKVFTNSPALDAGERPARHRARSRPANFSPRLVRPVWSGMHDERTRFHWSPVLCAA